MSGPVPRNGQTMHTINLTTLIILFVARSPLVNVHFIDNDYPTAVRSVIKAMHFDYMYVTLLVEGIASGPGCVWIQQKRPQRYQAPHKEQFQHNENVKGIHTSLSYERENERQFRLLGIKCE